MHKILRQTDKELKEIEEAGLNQGNLDLLSKLLDIKKDIITINAMEAEGKGMYEDFNYGRRGYGNDYNESYQRNYNSRGGYMRGNYNNRGYNGNQEEYMRKIMEGADMYSYGRERYEGGDSEERMLEGLDKLMYALCGFVQSTMEFAKTNEEREIIRKHLNKMNNL